MVFPDFVLLIETFRLRMQAEGLSIGISTDIKSEYSDVITGLDDKPSISASISHAVVALKKKEGIADLGPGFMLVFMDLCLMLNNLNRLSGDMEYYRMACLGGMGVVAIKRRQLTREESLAIWLSETTFKAKYIEFAGLLGSRAG